MAVDRGRRQAVADHHRDVTGLAAIVRQQALRFRIEHAPQVGTAQIIAPRLRPAGKLERRQAELAQASQQCLRVKTRMNRIAGARMVEREGEQCFGRQPRAGAAERDAGRRQVPEIADRTGAGGFMSPYSAGTEASRSRIE